MRSLFHLRRLGAVALAALFLAGGAAACKSPEAQNTAPKAGAAKTDDAKAKADAKPAADAKKADEPVTDAPKGAATSQPAPMKAGATGHFGAAFASEDAAKPLGDILKQAEANNGKLVKVSGKVQSVCKKKGCWLVMQTDADVPQTVRVTMKDYGFFAPKDCDGKTATIEGVLNRKVVKEAELKHLAEDQGQDPAKVTGDKEEFRLVANGIKITG